jgi:hypothetical protein
MDFGDLRLVMVLQLISDVKRLIEDLKIMDITTCDLGFIIDRCGRLENTLV